MSYFDFFRKNIENVNAGPSDRIRGTCHSMCPEDEIILREREKLVHVLEVWGPVRKLVKAYSRSAADSNMAVPSLLRPYPVLMTSLRYLLLDVANRVDAPSSLVYDYVNDRLRAVRQDMTIQRLPAEECVNLLEPMVRFYVYFGYRLCELPLKDFDPVLNKKYLLECLKWFLYCSDLIESENKNERVNDLASSLTNMDIKNRSFKQDRVLIESLYILCNLEDVQPLFRFVSLGKDLKGDPTLQLAYRIAIANLRGNYIQVSKLLQRLCPLNYCALFVYLPILQRRALQTMSHAYNSKRLTVPCSALRRWLSFASDNNVKTVCQHYGLTVELDAVSFDRGLFNFDATLHQPSKTSLPEKINMNIDHIFTYTTNK